MNPGPPRASARVGWSETDTDRRDTSIRVFLVDDHPVLRGGIRALIDLPTWRAFTDRGFTTEQAIEIVSELIECSLRAHSPASRVG